jgi:hypothetical protein
MGKGTSKNVCMLKSITAQYGLIEWNVCTLKVSVYIYVGIGVNEDMYNNLVDPFT